MYLIWTQPIAKPKLWYSDGGDKSRLGKWTVKSLKFVMAKSLLVSVISTFTVAPEIKKLLMIAILSCRLLLDYKIQ